MITKAKKLKIPWNCFKSKILGTREAEKIFQDGKEKKRNYWYIYALTKK